MYLKEFDCDIGEENDPERFSQATNSRNSKLCYVSMKDEMNFMARNQVWDPVE